MIWVAGFIKDDFDGHSLDNLDVVACGVFWREQTERRAASSLDAIDVALKRFVRVGIDGNFYRLAGPHEGQLCFFEIGVNPEIILNDGEDDLTDLKKCTLFDLFPGNAPRFRCIDFGIRELEFRLLNCGLSLLDFSAGDVDLRTSGGHLFGRGVCPGELTSSLAYPRLRFSHLRLSLTQRILCDLLRRRSVGHLRVGRGDSESRGFELSLCSLGGRHRVVELLARDFVEFIKLFIPDDIR